MILYIPGSVLREKLTDLRTILTSNESAALLTLFATAHADVGVIQRSESRFDEAFGSPSATGKITTREGFLATCALYRGDTVLFMIAMTTLFSDTIGVREVIEHLDGLHIKVENGHISVFGTIGRTGRIGDTFIGCAAQYILPNIPLGKCLGERDGVNIYVDSLDPSKVRWVVTRVAAEGLQTVVAETRKQCSPAFAPEELLPCALVSGADQTSYYWHPGKQKIYKLNNIGAPHGSSMADESGSSLIQTDLVARTIKRYLAPQNRVMVEIVVRTPATPGHEDITASSRRRVIWLEPTGEVRIENYVYVFALGGVDALTSDWRHEAVIPSVAGATRIIGLKTEFVWENGKLSVEHPLPRMTINTSPEHGVVFCGRQHYPYRILGQDLRPSFASMGVDLAKADRYAASDRYVLEKLDLVEYAGSRFWFDASTCRYWFPAVGSLTPFSVVATSQTEAWARYKVQYEIRDPSQDIVVQHNAERCEQIVQAYCGGRVVPTVSFGGFEYIWLAEWGESPYRTVEQSGSTDSPHPVPQCAEVVECVHCHRHVTEPLFTERTVNLPSGPRQGSICHLCGAHGDGEGGNQRSYGGSRMLGFYECSDCNEIFLCSAMSERDGVCETCCNNNYSDCERCGAVTHVANLNDDTVCHTCLRAGSRLRDYSFTPRLTFYTTKPEETICFGVEIELENGYDTESDGVAQHAASVLAYPGCNNFMFAKRDGSLSHGAEFVTQPFSWEWFKQNEKRMEDIFGRLQKEGFRAHTTCGLHIHVSRQPHSSLHEFRLLQLVYQNPNQWRKVSMRAGAMNYCRVQSEHVTLRERVRVSRERGRFGERYTALNPTDKGTLEWRLWAGTGTFERFKSALCMTAGAHAFVRSGATGVNPKWDKFTKFISEHSEYGAHVAPRLALAV